MAQRDEKRTEKPDELGLDPNAVHWSLRRSRVDKHIPGRRAAAAYSRFVVIGFFVAAGVMLGLIELAVRGALDPAFSPFGAELGAALQNAGPVVMLFLSAVTLVGLVVAAGFLISLGGVIVLRPYQDLERSQARLAQSEATARRLSIVAESATDMVLILNSQAQIDWANPAFYLTTGLTEDEVIGRDALSIGDAEIGDAKGRAEFREALRAGAPFESRLRATAKSGVSLELETRVSLSDAPDPAERKFIMLLRDVTNLRAYDRRLRKAIALLDDAFGIYDGQGRLVLYNDAFERLFGAIALTGSSATLLEVLTEFAGAGAVQGAGPAPERWAESEAAAMRAGDYERHVALATGDAFLFRTAQLDSGELVFMALDVSELTQARAEAEAAVASKARLLANITHEVRTPMNGVVAMAELLLDGDLPDQHRAGVDLIAKSGHQLLQLVDDMLDFSKIEAGKMPVVEEPFDLLDVIDEAGVLLAPKAQEKGVGYWLWTAPDIDRFLYGDAGRIRQIATNLLSNAVKFTDAGHVETRISTVRNGDDVDLLLEVEDTGSGVAEEELELIFAPYLQGERGRVSLQRGTGLGLSICRQLADLMGGELGARSTPGRGSVFSLKLTLRAAEPTGDAISAPADRRIAIAGEGRVREAIENRLAAIGANIADTTAHAELLIICFDEDHRPPVFDPPQADTPMLLIAGGSFDLANTIVAEAPDRRRLLSRPCATRHISAAITHLLHGVDDDEALADAESRPFILAAEDNETNATILRAMLREQEVDLQIEADGRGFLRACRRRRPDIALLDLNLPDMNGFELMAKLRVMERRRSRSQTPVIAATASSGEELRRKCVDAGMVGVLRKPLSKPELIAEIDAALTVRQPIARRTG